MKKKILIVEDEFVVANDLELMLEAAGYESAGIAVSAETAMEKITKNTPDLVLLDIQLQGAMSGIDLAKQLRTRHIAFVYLSANSDQGTLQKARSTEPYGFLVKPVRHKDLLVTLDIACYRHEHSLESLLFQRDHLRRTLTLLVNDPYDRATTLSAFAKALQVVVPFDFLCFVYSTGNAGHQFFGLYRSGFDEYQLIDNTGLGNIAAKKETQIDSLLKRSPAHQPIRQFTDEAYEQFLTEDPLASLLDNCYHFQSAIRGVIYIFNREPNTFDSRHASVIEEMAEVIGRLIHQVAHEKPTVQKGPGIVNAKHPVVKKFIGNSKSVLHCLDLAAQVAPLNTSVLIMGESGTGKELIAEAIHQLSQRSKQPFIKINCAALPYTLVESELFGYEKGAFTGASATKIGKFEAASGGTIFLDEIGEMSLEVQAKLLRVLQEKQVQRVGSHTSIEADVRVIAATNRDLEKAVAEHRFRLDLYFRLNVFPILLPPLRDRKDDIPLLATHLAKQGAATMGKEYCGISAEMLQALEEYHWPGNVRELENVIERALIVSAPNEPLSLIQPLAGHTVSAAHKISTIEDIKQQQERSERELIETALRDAKGKIRGTGGAAERLNIKPTTLESKLIRLRISREDFQ